MIFRLAWIVAILQHRFVRCQTLKNLIWNKQQQDFVLMSTVSPFDAIEKELFAKTRNLETHIFQGEKIVVTYYQERNIAMFYDNDTKVTGILGDIWDALGWHLNFTVIPLRNMERNFGMHLENGSYTGLMGRIHRNETHVILRSGEFSHRMGMLDFTIPLWKTRYHFYIRPEWHYQNTWLITIFASSTWYSILGMLIILGFVGHVLQKTMDQKGKTTKTEDDFSLTDHLFYTYAMMCAQGYVPDSFYNRFKILSLSRSVFAWLILLAFSSQMIYRMTNRSVTPPFSDIDSLMNRTQYYLLVFKGSMIFELVKQRLPEVKENDPNPRVRFALTPEEMYRRVCYSKKNYAILEVEDRFMASNRYRCRLMPSGHSMYETWIASAIRKNFKYKKTIDVTIIKMYEVGLVDALRDRWLDVRMENKERNQFKTIDLEQVYLIFMILCSGFVASFIVFVLERVIFVIKQEHLRASARTRRKLAKIKKKAAQNLLIKSKFHIYDNYDMYTKYNMKLYEPYNRKHY